jgi:uncharacterized membrane protein YeaQ/YmgE (transglycosylase-associated protein family)
MELIAWIIVGGIAGWVASMLMRTDAQMGCITNVIVGMIGSIVGGAIVVFLNTGTLQLSTAFSNFNLVSLLVSILGAVVLLWIVKMLRRTS